MSNGIDARSGYPTITVSVTRYITSGTVGGKLVEKTMDYGTTLEQAKKTAKWLRDEIGVSDLRLLSVVETHEEIAPEYAEVYGERLAAGDFDQADQAA